MSGWLPIYVRRIIAILLLLVDLGLEPGSALSFVGMADPEDNEAVADLCRPDDFWWGKTFAATPRLVQTSADCGEGTRRESAAQSVSAGAVAQAAFIPFNIGNVSTAAETSFELASSKLELPALNQHSLHRNSYIAQKRDIVLIV